MNRFVAMLAPIAALAAMPTAAAAPVTGKWMTEERDAIVTISQCGKSLCGKLTRFLIAPPDGVDQRDVNNPNASLRKRKLLGLPILTGFTEDGDEWRGKIYDPKSGKTYRSIMERQSGSKLTVKGCIGPFCQSQTWTRAR